MADLTLRSQYEQAQRMLRDKWPEGALVICRRILRAFPKHARTYQLMGQVCLRLGYIEEARGLFHRLLGVDPENGPAYAYLGWMYARQGLQAEALWHLQRAVELTPDDQDLRSLLARFGPHGSIRPKRVKMTRAALARAYIRGQLYSQALKELRAALAKHGPGEPPRLDLRLALAETLWREGQVEETQTACQQVLQALPNCLKANLILGQFWLRSERDEEGRALLQRAQTVDPENALAQELFGSRSPLPPRVVRIPPSADESRPLELPYLVDNETVVEEYITIEGQSSDAITDNVPDVATIATLDISSDSTPEGFSLLDVRRQYVDEHPDDYQARLDLARRLRDLWKLDLALVQYAALLPFPEVLPDVLYDLERLSRLFPDKPELLELVRVARERQRKEA